MCKCCEDIRNNLKCDIFCYTTHYKYQDDWIKQGVTETRILNNVPVNYCPMCGRKLGD